MADQAELPYGDWGIVKSDQANGRTKRCVNCGEPLGARHRVLCHALHKAHKEATRG